MNRNFETVPLWDFAVYSFRPEEETAGAAPYGSLTQEPFENSGLVLPNKIFDVHHFVN